ncbi:hypothetical protein [Gemmobacter serpentinus]|uniref:hypothetical protein n=1 Tax=Gemmobacter serpentinus TaxID=2652247 RepID=UPI00124CA84E|nr:hypothetical protein [Gemmobacter serpentinus]
MEHKTTTNRIKTSMIPDLKKAIRALAKTPPEDTSLKAALRQAMPEIHEARAAGRSFDDIAAAFTGFGVKITGSTLNSYFRDEMKANAMVPAGKEAQETSDKVPASNALVVKDEPRASEPASKLAFEDIADDPEEVTKTRPAPAAPGFSPPSSPSSYQMEEELRALNASMTDDIETDD